MPEEAKQDLSAVGLWGLLAGGAMLGVVPHLFAKRMKEKSMTALEKAFNGLVVLLCQKVAEGEDTIEKLRKELVERPTKKAFDEAVDGEEKAWTEVRGLQAHVVVLTKEIEELKKAPPVPPKRSRPSAGA